MKPNLLRRLVPLLLAAVLAGACSEDKYVSLSLHRAPAVAGTAPETLPLRERHDGSPIKILAIGNSFTNCAVDYMPRLIQNLNGDSVCFAKLVRSGASLQMHWTNHVRNNPDYTMYYSDAGEFRQSEITTFDMALTALDWDVIVIQQASAYSGIYSTYRPIATYLTRLFRDLYPDVSVAWQCTWAYMPGTDHPDFYRYHYDSDEMHRAILAACSQLCSDEDIDIVIPSAILVRRLRQLFPEVEDGFTYDGFHIDERTIGGYALSALWYESLVAPLARTSCLDSRIYFPFSGMDDADVDKALDLVEQTLYDAKW